jgi:hypothetical protein
MCENHGQLFGCLKQAFHAKALLCKIVIMIVPKVSFSKLRLQLRDSEEKTQLVSPETKILCSSEASASDLAQSRLSFSFQMLETFLTTR